MSPGGRKFRPVAVISCDISGHSTAAENAQLTNVTAINRIVGKAIQGSPMGSVVWSSGGDGGHVVLRGGHWQTTALSLVKELTRWASSANVSLRTTGHYGPVAEIKGADGRVQLVGEGINYAGWLINHLTVEGVVVSDSFKENFPGAGVRFHDPRLVQANGFGPTFLHLWSFDEVTSRWTTLVNHDHTRLRKAVKDLKSSEVNDPQDRKDPRDRKVKNLLSWEVVLYAKRVWQINSTDAEATAAVKGLRPEQLRPVAKSTEKRRLGLFDYMSPGELWEILHIGQLIERQAGSTVCAYDDEGDTMFVILRGEVGVYNTEGTGLRDSAKALYRLQEGELIGELAHALGRRRTADLIALTDIALLSFSSAELDDRLRKESGEQVRRFINIRVLEHASDNADYLVGSARGPLSRGSGADRALDALSDHARLLDVDKRHLKVGPEVLSAEAIGRRGLYILAAGTLSRKNGELLDGTKFPLLWADIPGLAETGEHRYERKSDMIKILHIAEEGLTALDIDQRRALQHRIDPRQADAFEFDVFISYSHTDADKAVVDALCAKFDQARIRYWVDKGEMQPTSSLPGKIGEGIDRSRFFVACVSREYLEPGWTMEELEAILAIDATRSSKGLILLMVDDAIQEADLPTLARSRQRAAWSRPQQIEKIVSHIRLGG